MIAPTGVLTGMRVIEGSAFVAAPLGGMTLAQMGADVIRFDPIGGGLDYGRWPLHPSGQSLFWAGMNKGKRSIQVDLRSTEGRELVTALVTSPGEDAGMFLTNFPATGWLCYDRLREHRPDLIMVALSGNHDGTSEVDYTVHPATGFPLITGPTGHREPVNSVLPAWDIALGSLAATGLLAAERHRRNTGAGQLVRSSLSDVAFAMVGNLGRIAQAAHGCQDGPADRDGNYLYGAFGAPFETQDGRHVMVVGLTSRQWTALKGVTELSAEDCAAIETAAQVDLDTESGRYHARTLIAEHLRRWFARRSFAEATAALTAGGASWGPYQRFDELLDDPRIAPEHNPMFAAVDHPGVGVHPVPASPLDFSATGRPDIRMAPRLGEHTDAVLSGVLGLTAAEIGVLHDRGIVA